MENTNEIARQESKSNAPLIILGMSIFVMSLSVFGLLLHFTFGIDSYILIPYISFLFTMQMAWIIYSNYKSFNSLLNPFTLFIIALILFNGGQIIVQGFSFTGNIIYGGYRHNEIQIVYFLFQ